MGKYEYIANDNTHKGFFNVYQSRNGAIMLIMGTQFITLTNEQVDHLPIDPYSLEDFNHDDYKTFYNI